jgi:hypothetical protein
MLISDQNSLFMLILAILERVQNIKVNLKVIKARVAPNKPVSTPKKGRPSKKDSKTSNAKVCKRKYNRANQDDQTRIDALDKRISRTLKYESKMYFNKMFAAKSKVKSDPVMFHDMLLKFLLTFELFQGSDHFENLK